MLDDGNLSLIEEGIDIALCIGELEDSGFTARKLGEVKQCVIGTPGYFTTAGMPQRPEDLLQHEMVIYHRRGGGEHGASAAKENSARCCRGACGQCGGVRARTGVGGIRTHYRQRRHVPQRAAKRGGDRGISGLAAAAGAVGGVPRRSFRLG